MKAWRVTRTGEPQDVMALVDAPDPEPAEDQLLVRVHAVALNFPDVLMCRGTYQVRPPLPYTPGIELCGVVVACDAGSGFSPGERIIGTPALPHGALGEFALVPAADAYAAPPELDDAAAAAMHIAYQTAWFGLHRRAGLRSGETLLVNAAAGGVGSAAVQLGRAAGARVIAVVGGAHKAAVAADLGADVVLDRTQHDLIPAIKQATGGRGADVVFDPVGGDSFDAASRCVAFEGRIVLVGFASGTIPAPPLSHALVKNYSLLGLHWGLYRQYDPEAVAQAHHTLSNLAADGAVAPLVGGRFTLDEAADGLTRLSAGDSVGRLVVALC
ncbi:MAG TPA: NADPH:quinone oxidoreductase family protein [Jiangellaceae bacterium]